MELTLEINKQQQNSLFQQPEVLASREGRATGCQELPHEIIGQYLTVHSHHQATKLESGWGELSTDLVERPEREMLSPL